MADSAPSCRQAVDDLVAILDILSREEIITSPVSVEVVRTALSSCKSCRGQKPKPRKCCGWSGSFHGTTTIEMPFEVKGRYLVAKVGGKFNFKRRSTHGRRRLKDWQSAPIVDASFSIEISQATAADPEVRHHIDLANPDQHGPLWHLQMGGLSSSEARDKSLEWLDVPRWPVLPMDMILVLELATYNFQHEAWIELHEKNPWRDIIKRSERLMHQHYLDRLDIYRNRGDAGHSWLSYQCNRTSDWNPRPE